jgi:hypothetical protein
VVRRPAAVLTSPVAALAAYAAALAYFALADSLPALGTTDATAIASGAVAMVALAACTLTLLPARDEPAALLALAAGGLLLGGALTASGVDPGANVAKALFAASAGMLLASWLSLPQLVVIIPVFVAAIDVVSVLSGPTSVLLRERSPAVDYLSFAIPGWGGGGEQLGVADVVFLGFYASAAWRHGLRRTATAIGLLLGLVAAVVAGVLTDRTLPVLPALAVGLLLPNLDRLGPLLSTDDGG